MTKAGDRIIASARQALAFAHGEDVPGFKAHVPDEIDTKRMRKKLSLSQEEFANRYRIPLGTLRDWEQGRRMPDSASRVLLAAIDNHPDIIAKVAAGVVYETKTVHLGGRSVVATVHPNKSEAVEAARKVARISSTPAGMVVKAVVVGRSASTGKLLLAKGHKADAHRGKAAAGRKAAKRSQKRIDA